MPTSEDLSEDIAELACFEEDEYMISDYQLKMQKSALRKIRELLKTHPETSDNLQNQEEKNLRSHLADNYSR